MTILSRPDLHRLWNVLPEARVVGGAVRDALAGRPLADIDLATPRLPDDTQAACERAGLRVIPTGLAHGTVTVLVEGAGYEVTTLRRDVRTDGRHAVVAFTDDWQADAARRDFTINAMSADRAGQVFDYFAGKADLAAGVVRFVGNPVARIAEDFLRVLRFFRFFARYGRGEPEAATAEALAGGIPGLARLSPERVWSELSRLLALPEPEASLILMDRLGILAAVLPQHDLGRLLALLRSGAPASAMLRLAALTDAPVPVLADRLRLSGAEAETLAALRGPPPPEDAAAWPAWLADTPSEILVQRSWLHGGSAAQRSGLAALPRPVFPVQGRDLVAAGVPPGPELGRLLAELRRRWKDLGCTPDRAHLLAGLSGLPDG